LRKFCTFRYRKPPGHQTDLTKIEPRYIIIKATSTENRERVLKFVRKRKQITYKDKPIKITVDFSMETAWSEIFWALNENNFNSRILSSKTVIQNRWSNKSLP
jgi:hypothetical protein